MTKLEKRIYDHAIKLLSVMEKNVKKIKTDTRFIKMNFFFDGCFDSLVYDKKIGKFTKIEYRYGVGKSTSINPLHKTTAYFDDFEIREIKIENDI